MYIEEVILEGFKSYATRTVISGWDPEFNAITGLNGSGKSNILDAICFVLGIDNLRQVRATTLQDLVYKRGQSGITKASVSLVFNNTDAKQSPVGYVDCPQITVTRQIILGGKNRYLINGHLAQQKQVDTLFHSVQLNVNNPHFLIMQGQITKVLNMRPPEILAMVEESAGTRMFEDRKEKALQTLDKKESKVREIGGLLSELIDPKLALLRSQRHDFVEYKRSEAELERSKKIIVAYDYVTSKNNLANTEDEIIQTKENMDALQVQESSYKLELSQIEKKLDELARKRQKEMKNADKLKALEEQVGELEREKTRLSTQLELLSQTQNEEKLKMAELVESESKLKAQLEEKQAQYAKEERIQSDLTPNFETSKANLARDEELLMSLHSGVDGSVAFNKLISDIKDKNVNITVELEAVKQRITSIEKELKDSRPQIEKAQKGCSGVVAKIDSLRKEIDQLQTQLDNMPANADTNNDTSSLQRDKKRLESELAEVSEAVHSLKSQVNHSLKFDYQLPPNTPFDAEKVRGVVAGLVELPEENLKYATALEVAAGGRLYNVVVDDESTAKTLLERGRLSKRVTIIPLNKIVPKEVNSDKCKIAHKLTNGHARLALSLIGYEEQVEAAMRYVFGGTFICDDKESATKVTFDKSVSIRTVTVDGDVYEPSGTLTGGSSPSNGTALLEKITAYNQRLSEERDLQLQLDVVLEKLDQIESSSSGRDELVRQLELKQHEYSLLQQQLEQNASGKLIGHVKHLESQLEANKSRLEQLIILKKNNDLELTRIEGEQSELFKDKKSKIKSLEKQVAALKKTVQRDEAEHKKMVSRVELLSAMMVKANNDLKEVQVAINTCKLVIDESEAELNRLAEFLETVKLESELKQVRACDVEMQQLSDRKSYLQDNLEKAHFDLKQLHSTKSRQEEDLLKYRKESTNLLKQHPWIVDQEHLFNQPGTAYDWSTQDLDQVKRTVKLLEEQHGALRKTINVNVMDMIDRYYCSVTLTASVESKETALKQMLSTVKKDKVKIEGTIDKLEDYKVEALERTWRQVNEYKLVLVLTNDRDFGAIFGELLPGSFARLDKPDGQQTITAGLEIKVRLGATWKDSLSELSGGQRSLIALSLILALLRHKPAPLYILDEVDAALDPAHTQNIGRILRSARFNQAQFIIVSLKEGMFGNANVLFRTRFRDGISSVERTSNSASAGSEENTVKTRRIRVNKNTISV